MTKLSMNSAKRTNIKIRSTSESAQLDASSPVYHRKMTKLSIARPYGTPRISRKRETAQKGRDLTKLDGKR